MLLLRFRSSSQLLHVMFEGRWWLVVVAVSRAQACVLQTVKTTSGRGVATTFREPRLHSHQPLKLRPAESAGRSAVRTASVIPVEACAACGGGKVGGGMVPQGSGNGEAAEKVATHLADGRDPAQAGAALK